MEREFDNPSMVTIEVEADGAAKKVEVGFSPRKVEVVAVETGHMAVCFKGVEQAVKFAPGASMIDNPITFNDDNTTVTLGVEAALNINGQKTLLVCYK